MVLLFLSASRSRQILRTLLILLKGIAGKGFLWNKVKESKNRVKTMEKEKTEENYQSSFLGEVIPYKDALVGLEKGTHTTSWIELTDSTTNEKVWFWYADKK